LTPFGSVPALYTSNRFPACRRSSASAIWLRAELPVHRNSTAGFILALNHHDLVAARHRAEP
jgi:hypothetical protein